MTSRPKVVTSYVHPPIPTRYWDWCAFREGAEELGNYGWGPTAPDAVAALIEIEADLEALDEQAEAYLRDGLHGEPWL